MRYLALNGYSINSEFPLNVKGNALFDGGKVFANLFYTNGAGRFQAEDDNHTVNLGGSGVIVANKGTTVYKPIQASAFNVASSMLVKENVSPVTVDDARKILQLNPVEFDYIPEIGGKKRCHGLIAEDVLKILPSCVEIPDGYKESDFDKAKGLGNKLLSIDYSKFVPYLIKMVQIQQDQIDELQGK